MEKLADIEIALTLARHIKNPWGIIVNGKNYNLRPFYIELAYTMKFLSFLWASHFAGIAKKDRSCS